jgi:hypothetical protein
MKWTSKSTCIISVVDTLSLNKLGSQFTKWNIGMSNMPLEAILSCSILDPYHLIYWYVGFANSWSKGRISSGSISDYLVEVLTWYLLNLCYICCTDYRVGNNTCSSPGDYQGLVLEQLLTFQIVIIIPRSDNMYPSDDKEGCFIPHN